MRAVIFLMIISRNQNQSKSQNQKNIFHLGLELEDIDEVSSIEDEYDDYDEGNSIRKSPISDELDDDDDFDISELYRKIPPKTRAAVKF